MKLGPNHLIDNTLGEENNVKINNRTHEPSTFPTCNGGTLIKHCSPEFRKQVLPKFLSPTGFRANEQRKLGVLALTFVRTESASSLGGLALDAEDEEDPER